MITIKTEKDIEILREGGRRHANILRELAAMVKPGLSTEELNVRALELAEASGDTPSFLNYTPRGVRKAYPAGVCVSVNDVIVHGIPNVNPLTLREGDIVTIDFGLTHEGLVTDAAVTLGVGAIDEDSQKLIDVCRNALAKGIEAAKGGNRIGDIGSAIETYIESFGLGIADDLSGHGVGYGVHEDPFVPNRGKKGQGALLKPGMVLALEPMVTLGGDEVVFEEDEYTVRTADGSRASHFEHTILITEGEAEILTK